MNDFVKIYITELGAFKRTEFFTYFCIKNSIGTQSKVGRPLKWFNPPAHPPHPPPPPPPIR